MTQDTRFWLIVVVVVAIFAAMFAAGSVWDELGQKAVESGIIR